MKIALIADYFTPYTPGGAEWSVYYLALDLKNKSLDNVVITPNYGAAERENINGISVIRFPFFKKLENNHSVVNPIWQNNPVFFLMSALWIVKIAMREKLKVLHVQGKFLIPGAFLASKILNIPLVITSRDKQFICSYGRCFFEENRYKGCSWFEYLTKDFTWYYENYVREKSFKTYIYNLMAAVWTRFSYMIISWFAKRATVTIAISKSHKKYLEENGFKRVRVIYNTMKFENDLKLGKGKRGILYAGKLSLGKGVFEILRAIPKIVGEYPEKFLFAGGNDSPKEIENLIKIGKIKKFVTILGSVNHQKLQSLYKNSKLVLMPSIYPESFGRVALEALVAGTPVVVSNRGGISEIVDNRKTGVVVSPDSKALSEGIKVVLGDLKRYTDNVKAEHENLKKKFGQNPIKEHIKMYKELSR